MEEMGGYLVISACLSAGRQARLKRLFGRFDSTLAHFENHSYGRTPGKPCTIRCMGKRQ
ncbi:MAG: hypothetical protein L0922_03775 [Candidatus Mariimomonas ferrooxydans]